MFEFLNFYFHKTSSENGLVLLPTLKIITCLHPYAYARSAGKIHITEYLDTQIALNTLTNKLKKRLE